MSRRAEVRRAAGNALGRSLERVTGMVGKELRQIFRDPRLARVIFIAPIIQLMVFGYAVSTDIRNTTTFVVDHDRTRASRELVEAFTASGYFRVTGRSQRPEEMVSALDHGDAILGLAIPPGFAADLARGEGEVQLLFDGTNSNIATVAKGYAERIVSNFGLEATAVRLEPAVALEERAWFNPDLESRNYNVPAVAGTLVLLVCLLLTSLAVVREKEIGTLEQLMVSPLQPWELMAGKTFPFAVIGLVDLAVVTAVALAWFDVPFEGSFLVLLAGSVLFLVNALGVGLLISTISSTQQEAFMATFLVFMPTILLSGFLFPVASMPELFQWLTVVNPLRHYLEIVRAVFLKGTGAAALGQQFLALALLGVLLMGLAVRRFQKRTS